MAILNHLKQEEIKLSKEAQERIDELKTDNPDVFIRIMIIPGGCAGNKYHILMDDYIGETDKVLQIKGKIYVVIDEVSLEMLTGSTLDFSDQLEFSGFTIQNPNITATCSCGNSFSCTENCVLKKPDCEN